MSWLGMFLEGRWLEHWLQLFCNQFPEGSFFSYRFNLIAALALVLVSLNCGMVGSLVVGSRMAFFSDALAHCAFAGVSIGFVIFAVFLSGSRPDSEFWNWVTPVMIIFGILVGYGIALVRQRTGLASDTVIGVFFAGAIGLAAMIRRLISSRHLFSLEDFLFGDPLVATGADLVNLFLLTLVTAGLLAFIYNRLLLSSFNPSLALSRRVSIQLVQYLFVMLLALVVNLCLRGRSAADQRPDDRSGGHGSQCEPEPSADVLADRDPDRGHQPGRPGNQLGGGGAHFPGSDHPWNRDFVKCPSVHSVGPVWAEVSLLAWPIRVVGHSLKKR